MLVNFSINWEQPGYLPGASQTHLGSLTLLPVQLPMWLAGRDPGSI